MVHEVVGSRTAYDWVLRRAVLALNGAHLVTWTVDSFDDPVISGSKRISSFTVPSKFITSLQRRQATSPILKPARCVSNIIALLRCGKRRVLM